MQNFRTFQIFSQNFFVTNFWVVQRALLTKKTIHLPMIKSWTRRDGAEEWREREWSRERRQYDMDGIVAIPSLLLSFTVVRLQLSCSWAAVELQLRYRWAAAFELHLSWNGKESMALAWDASADGLMIQLIAIDHDPPTRCANCIWRFLLLDILSFLFTAAFSLFLERLVHLIELHDFNCCWSCILLILFLTGLASYWSCFLLVLYLTSILLTCNWMFVLFFFRQKISFRW